MDKFEREFNIFSSNINQAARSFYYHKEISRQVHEDGLRHKELLGGHFQDSRIFEAVNANAQFWNDHKKVTIMYTIVALGKVFDENKASHGVKRLINLASKSDGFTKEKLRARKIAGSTNSNEWIDAYMLDVVELETSDYRNFLRLAAQTRKLWKKNIKSLRNKIIAHQDVLSENKKMEILEKATYAVIENIIQKLLTVERIFFEAYHNGKKPDFDYVNSDIQSRVQSDVESLLARLSR